LKAPNEAGVEIVQTLSPFNDVVSFFVRQLSWTWRILPAAPAYRDEFPEPKTMNMPLRDNAETSSDAGC
jgi:hypothetical protein